MIAFAASTCGNPIFLSSSRHLMVGGLQAYSGDDNCFRALITTENGSRKGLLHLTRITREQTVMRIAEDRLLHAPFDYERVAGKGFFEYGRVADSSTGISPGSVILWILNL